jgi:hypothetical protein
MEPMITSNTLSFWKLVWAIALANLISFPIMLLMEAAVLMVTGK